MNNQEKNIVRGVWEVRKVFRHEIKNKENFAAARKHLELGSLLVYTNHFHKLDTAVMGDVVQKNIAPLDKIAFLGAMKHLDPSRSRLSRGQRFIADGLNELYGLRTFLIIQEEEKEKYENPNEFNRRSLKQAIEFLNTPGNVLVVAPEGTRSKTGKLIEAKDGMDLLFRLSRKNTLAMPVAVQPYPDFPGKTSILPFLTNTQIIAGEPFSYQEISDEQKFHPGLDTKTLMMNRLAANLREENRGFYK